MRTFAEVDMLTREVESFLKGLGGGYSEISESLQKTLILCITTGQYIVNRDLAGAMLSFVCYYRFCFDDMPLVARKIVTPVTNGNALYIVEHGRKRGKSSPLRDLHAIMDKEPGTQFVCWHKRGDAFKIFQIRRAKQ